MLKSSIGVSREGIPYILITAFITLVFAVAGWIYVALPFVGLTLFVGHFFRDPERVQPHDENKVVSPADGKVIKIEREIDPITGVEKQVVAVFMNVFNVHVNRTPVAGTVKEIQYIPGKFINASFDKASTDNERCGMEIVTDAGESFTMVQIAGLIARRIVCWAEKGDKLGRSERYGLIKFGSRVDLYIPDGYSVLTKVGDKVVAGETPLAIKK
ncbi:MAG: phosphatidylserine decarboxylase family protein [Desulfovibrio sp.]